MELYHLHLKNYEKDKWKKDKVLVVDDDFENRLCKRVNNFSLTSNSKILEVLVSMHSAILTNAGFIAEDNYNLNDMISTYLFGLMPNMQLSKTLLEESARIIQSTVIFKREMALENYRRDNCNMLPSRLHCLYATDEAGVEYWKRVLMDGDMDVYRIDIDAEPFKTNEQLLTTETSNYKDIYNGAYSYWNPKIEDLQDLTCEYLVKGKVKILEMVDSIRR